MSAKLHAWTMPKWGLEMTEGNFAQWLVAEGQAIEKGTPLAVIETEKIANEAEATASGTLVRRIARDGDVLPVGALLAVIADGAATAAEIDAFVASYAPIGLDLPPAAAAVATEEPAAVAAPVAEAPIVKAAPARPEPRTFAVDAALNASPVAQAKAHELGLSLDAITGSGRNGRITAQDVARAAAGAARHDGGPVLAVANISPVARALALALGLDGASLKGSGRNGRITAQDVEQAARKAGKTVAEIAAAADEVRASPLARRMADRLGVSLSGVAGSGPRGRILRADVEAARRRPAVTGENPYRAEKLSLMRRTIAQRLEEAKRTIPHFYLTIDVELDALLSVRAQANARKDVAKLSVNDFIIRAAGLALAEIPDCNVCFVDGERRLYSRADIAVAVAVDGGLVTPVVRGADLKSVDDIAAEVRDLATRARAGKLAPDEYKGGAFSISNLGMYGIRSFDAVINPPQGAILAVGAAEKRMIVRNDAPAVATMLTVTMSCDHRVIDGALGAEWLAAFKALMESPVRLIL